MKYMLNLGLNRYRVELRFHDKDWDKVFLKTKELLQKILKAYTLEIEHIGSTSIENMVSKPIIDIAIGLSDIKEIEAVVEILEKNDFIYRGDSRNDGGFLFVKEIEKEVRTHHLHIVDLNDGQWADYIFFRNTLRSNHKLREAYQKLKRELEQKFKNDRKKYTSGKAEFIKQILSER